MPVNIKRGFNRAFVVLSGLWALYILIVFPVMKRNDADRNYGSHLRECTEPTHTERLEDCTRFVEAIYGPEMEQWTLRSYYKTAWPYLLIVIIVLPIVVYGILRVAGLLFMWVRRGFAE
jgi:hypothetical protein